MEIYRTDKFVIAREGRVEISVPVENLPEDYVTFLRSELDRFYEQERLLQQQEGLIETLELDNWTKWQKVRQKRDKLLAKSDWTQMPNAPLTLEQKFAWAEYRQKLRDLPQDFNDPDKVIFPQEPK
jgi:hypothetical protein